MEFKGHRIFPIWVIHDLGHPKGHTDLGYTPTPVKSRNWPQGTTLSQDVAYVYYDSPVGIS